MTKYYRGHLGTSTTKISKLNKNKQCLIPNCKGSNKNWGYCLNHFPKSNKTVKKGV